uniref:ARAD1A01276p n=1 Tax=Blastobotrys adeninivorans TaxID=409370 RepID=A0A060SWF0_BLAAD
MAYNRKDAHEDTAQNTVLAPAPQQQAAQAYQQTAPTVSQVLGVVPFYKIANPGPIGLISFAITTFCVGLYHCGAGLPGTNPQNDEAIGPDTAVIGMAVFVGGIAQFAAGMWEMRVGNTFGATVHTLYGGFWLAYSCFLIPFFGISKAYGKTEAGARALSFALGIFMTIWCFLTVTFCIAALRTNVAILATLGSLALAFLMLGIGQYLKTLNPVSSMHCEKAGGALAVVCSVCALYAGAAGLMLPQTTPVSLVLPPLSRVVPAEVREPAVL